MLRVAQTVHDRCIRSGSTTCGAPPINYMPRDSLVLMWNFFYWTSFLMTWLIVPLEQSYVETGEFTVWQKIKQSVKENMYFYLAAGVLGGVLLVVVSLTSHMSLRAVIGISLALANVYGMLILIAALGWGLVEVPRQVWYHGDMNRELRFAGFMTDANLQGIEDAKTELATVVVIIRKLQAGVQQLDASLLVYAQKMIALCPMDFEPRMQSYVTDAEAELAIDKQTRSSLAWLHRRLFKAIFEMEVQEHLYERNLKQAFFVQDVLKNKNNPDRIIRSVLRPPPTTAIGKLLGTMAWWWYVRIAPIGLRCLAIVLGIVSLLVVWSECVMFLMRYHRDQILSVFALILQAPGMGTGVWLQLFTFLPVFYISWCAYYSLFKLQIMTYYRMHPGVSSQNSLLFSAAYLARLATPLCYNYLHIIHQSETKDTSFSIIMGDLEIVPFFGETFNTIFPIFVVALCLFNLCHGYSLVLKWLDVPQFAYDSAENSTTAQGLQLLERERERAERHVRTSGQDAELHSGITSRTTSQAGLTPVRANAGSGPKLSAINLPLPTDDDLAVLTRSTPSRMPADPERGASARPSASFRLYD